MIRTEVVANWPGQWARKPGLICGVDMPLRSGEHHLIVTQKMEGAPPDLLVMRDSDCSIRFKEEEGGLVMGGFDPVTV